MMGIARRHGIKYGLQFVGWVIFFLTITEVFTRIAIVSFPSFSSKVNGGGVEIYGVEGYGIIYYLPNMEIATPYSGGENIVFLGDSNTQARQVPYWKNYSSVAERVLRSAGYKMDVRNFGYMASTLPYQIAIGESLTKTYQPHLLIMQIAMVDLTSERVFDKTAPYYFSVTKGGDLIVKVRSSKDNDYLKLQSRITKQPGFSFFTRFSIETYLGIQRNQQTDDPDVELQPMMTNAEKSQAEMKGAEKFIIKELALLEKTYGDIPIIFVLRPSFSEEKLEFYYEAEIRRVASLIEQRSSWQTICVDVPFNKILQNGLSPIGFGNTDPFSGHWNARGHDIAGKAIAEKIAEVLYGKVPTSPDNQCMFK